MAILSILLTVIIVTVSILMVLVVLIQRPKQEGLGAAFGGGALDSALGAHTTDVLQKFTSWLGIIFFVSAISLAMVKTRQYRASAADGILESVEQKEAAPALPPGLAEQLSNIPGAESITIDPAPATDPTSALPAPKVETPAPAPKATETPAPAPKATTPAPAPAPKANTPAPAPKTDTPAPATPAPAAKAPAPATTAPATPAPATPVPAADGKAK